MADESPAHRRRRVRRPAGNAGPPSAGTAAQPVVTTPALADPGAQTPALADPSVADVSADDRDLERGLRSLVGGGSSQVSVSAAMRARDAARPTDADLAAAAARLVIVRRGWQPPD